jgi:hypothetical protein
MNRFLLVAKHAEDRALRAAAAGPLALLLAPHVPRRVRIVARLSTAVRNCGNVFGVQRLDFGAFEGAWQQAAALVWRSLLRLVRPSLHTQEAMKNTLLTVFMKSRT